MTVNKIGDIYEGDFTANKSNKEHGYGKVTQFDGQRYEGDWKEGKRTGKGIKTWSNGDRYEG